MKAMVLKKFGGIENFMLEDVPMPQLRPQEILVRNRAIGLNPIDLKTRKGGGMASRFQGQEPILLGWDISGVVVERGKEVKEWKEGDEVFGTVRFPGCGNAYAEYVAVPADQIARKPDGLSHPQAAATALAALTAWQALVDTGNIRKDAKVLVHGAAGGVGHFAVQIAKYFDACVVATASGEDADFVKQLGADEVIDYKNQRFEEITAGFDLILDTVGGENFIRSLKVLKPDGLIVLLPSDKAQEAEQAARERHLENYRHILVHSSGSDMRQIASMLETGRMRAHVDKIFPFPQLPEAHSALEKGKGKGKIVVTLRGGGSRLLLPGNENPHP